MKTIVIAVTASMFAAGCGMCPSRSTDRDVAAERARVADTNEFWQQRNTPVIVAAPSETTSPTQREWTSTAPATPATRDANNTKMNERDREGALPTPVDQKSNDADIGRTTTIRKRILELNLSIDAQNVKVITQTGRVTLRGPVNSQSEKDAIDRIARDVAGAAGVDDLLEVVAAR